jgi:hypothetical protein
MTYSHSRPHLILVPQSEPPYDDELEEESAVMGLERRSVASGNGGQGRALAFPHTSPSRVSEGRRPSLRLVTRDGETVAPPLRDDDSSRPIRSSDGVVRPLDRRATTITRINPRPDLPTKKVPPGMPRQPSGQGTSARSTLIHQWISRLVQAIVEVLAGTRTLSQLHPWTSPNVYRTVRSRHRAMRSHPGSQPVLRSVHVNHPRPGVAEVCAVLRCGPRGQAMALRFEEVDGRWLCTALEMR